MLEADAQLNGSGAKPTPAAAPVKLVTPAAPAAQPDGPELAVSPANLAFAEDL